MAQILALFCFLLDMRFCKSPCYFIHIPVLAVQDLVDYEHVDGIEWSQESEDEADETAETMDVED